jgi:CBS domain-containing protein
MSVELEKAGLNRLQNITTIATMDAIHCKDSESIISVAKKILLSTHRSFPVMKKNSIVGIITIIDILNAFMREQNMNDSISTIMSRDVIYSNNYDTIVHTLQKFKFSRRGRFPILNKEKLVGIITERDIVKHFTKVSFGIPIKELMTTKPFFMQPSATIFECLKSVVNTRYRRLPIVSNKKLVGMITAADILKYLHSNNFNLLSLSKPVESIMIKNIFSVGEDEDISDAINIVKEKDIGGLPVVDEKNNLVGFITERDILEEII